MQSISTCLDLYQISSVYIFSWEFLKHFWMINFFNAVLRCIKTVKNLLDVGGLNWYLDENPEHRQVIVRIQIKYNHCLFWLSVQKFFFVFSNKYKNLLKVILNKIIINKYYNGRKNIYSLLIDRQLRND